MDVLKFFFVLFLGMQVLAQNYDLYETAAKKKSRMIVFVHGGAWIGGNKSQYQRLGKKLLEVGFCAAIVDYRLAPGAVHPAPLEDLDSALIKISKINSKKCDASNIFLVGHFEKTVSTSPGKAGDQ